MNDKLIVYFSRSGHCRRLAEEIAVGELGLDVYPNQIEVITAEQMLDAYASMGMPLFYKHWSFGKHYAYHETLYRKGWAGLAYEIVINSSPCVSYLMEGNTATMQTRTPIVAESGLRLSANTVLTFQGSDGAFTFRGDLNLSVQEPQCQLTVPVQAKQLAAQ